MSPCAAAVIVASVTLIQLTGPDGQRIDVVPSAVVSLREPRSAEHFAPGTKCLLHMTDGKVIMAADPCDDIRRLIEEGAFE